MARLQILELPEGSSDDRPPFVLVVDESMPQRILLGFDNPIRDYWQDIADKIGARAVIVTPETVEIPANDTSAYLCESGEAVRSRADETQGRTAEALRLAHERTDIARDMDRLAKRRNELADALGIDRLRDWDDMRNAAARLRQERDAQALAIGRVRDLHRPVEYRGTSICVECSAFAGSTTDNAPVAYNQCGTLRALNGETERSPEE
ncbi:hypothetical protein [Streptomyces sp. CC224B]|uniref:hypothetical protein n=1 Tax=Streptomyces sp. CC224B TaxID=3044571 RepID=UPI0024A86B97|nr:hypothetical protein [Streptomyces sp. CC224B]